MIVAIQIDTWIDYVIAIGAILTTFGLVGRYVVAPLIRGWRRLSVKWDEIEATCAFVAQEMKPNGGSSLRDVVNRIEATVAAHEGRLVLDAERFEKIELKLKAAQPVEAEAVAAGD